MKNSESSTKEPIKYFKEFFMNNGYQKFRENFIHWCCQQQKEQPNCVQLFEHDEDIIIHQRIANDLGETDDFKTSLIDTLEETFKYQAEKSKEFIDKAILEYLEKHNDADKFLMFQEKKLSDLLTTNGKYLEEFPLCKTYLDSIIEFIKGSYSYSLKGSIGNRKRTDISRDVTKQDEEVIQYSFFGGYNIKYKFLKWLYGRFCEHFVIEELDDNLLGEKQFIEIFSSLNPKQSGFTIQFKINNIEVAYIVDSLHPYFKNLNPTSIDKSQCFLKNSSKKPFSRNDLYPAFTKLKKGLSDQSLKIHEDVKAFVNEIKNHQLINKQNSTF